MRKVDLASLSLRLDREVDVWWSKSREEPLARKMQRRPANQDQILESGIIGSTQFLSGARAPLFFYGVTHARMNAFFSPIENSIELAA